MGSALAFPSSKLPPPEDATERIWSAVASFAGDFEQAADGASVSRCIQLHERLHACLQTLNDADARIHEQWDAALVQNLRG